MIPIYRLSGVCRHLADVELFLIPVEHGDGLDSAVGAVLNIEGLVFII